MEYWAAAAVTLCSAGLGLVFSAGRVRAGQGNERLNALYLLARSAALVLLALIPLAVYSRPLLGAVTAAMLAVQLIDGEGEFAGESAHGEVAESIARKDVQSGVRDGLDGQCQ